MVRYPVISNRASLVAYKGCPHQDMTRLVAMAIWEKKILENFQQQQTGHPVLNNIQVDQPDVHVHGYK